MRKWLFAIFVLLSNVAFAQSEQRFKALLIYKISEYVVWPGENEKIVVGVVGGGKMYDVLHAFSQKRDHITVKNIDDVNQITDCQIVYIPDHDSDQMPLYRMTILDKSILVISDEKNLITKGADISIYTEGERLKYIVNKGTIEAKGMMASGKLLSLGNSF